MNPETDDLVVYNLDHHGIVAGIIDQIGLVELIDDELGSPRGEKVSSGTALKAAILNALGFISAPLYLFEHFFTGKPTEHLLGPGITSELLNDDRIGRLLDDLFKSDLTSVFLKIALSAKERFEVPMKSVHLDSSSFHVHGAYIPKKHHRELDEPVPIRITQGYSRDKRPDLKQFIVDLMVTGEGGVPLFFAAADGNQSDTAAFTGIIREFQRSIDLDATVVVDSALYSEDNLAELHGIQWVTRVPARLSEAKALLESDIPEAAWTEAEEGYRLLARSSHYGGVEQRWLLIESEARKERARRSLDKRERQKHKEHQKAKRALQRQEFACHEDAVRAVEEFKKQLTSHRLSSFSIHEKRRYARRGRPAKDTPFVLTYQVELELEENEQALSRAQRRAGRFILATNELSESKLPDALVLTLYKGQIRTVERGFRFLKDPLFFTSSVFLKTPSRVASLAMIMALALLVYTLGEVMLRRQLLLQGAFVPDQKGKPTNRPTLRWVFQFFHVVHFVCLAGLWRVVGLTDERKRVVEALGRACSRYYLTP